MKKTLSVFTMAIVLSVGFSSCRKCEVCTKDSESEVRVCEGDYNTKTQYGFTIDSYEASGYECR